MIACFLIRYIIIHIFILKNYYVVIREGIDIDFYCDWLHKSTCSTYIATGLWWKKLKLPSIK